MLEAHPYIRSKAEQDKAKAKATQDQLNDRLAADIDEELDLNW